VRQTRSGTLPRRAGSRRCQNPPRIEEAMARQSGSEWAR
jgi:hypothetical protein